MNQKKIDAEFSKKASTNDEYFNMQLDISPLTIRKFITYLSVIEQKSPKTCYNYFRDIILFFKYIVTSKGIEVDYPKDEFDDKDYITIISGLSTVVDNTLIATITRFDVEEFLYYLKKSNNASPETRNRRLSSLRKFFNYCDSEINIIVNNPTKNLPRAKKEKKVPVYLTLEESLAVLQNVPEGKNYERDFCMVTFFLNLGLRLTELCSINISDIKDDSLKIMGKGSKERVLHLNDACMDALESYLNVRFSNNYYVVDKNALFISSQSGERIKQRRVEQIVNKTIELAGLQGKGYSAHKFRHTAATLMYNHGVDVLVLKDVLGHENIGTTQIYAHVNNDKLKEATELNPLSKKGKG